jgi:hypothetical protein
MTKIFPLPPFYKTSKKRGFTMWINLVRWLIPIIW